MDFEIVKKITSCHCVTVLIKENPDNHHGAVQDGRPPSDSGGACDGGG